MQNCCKAEAELAGTIDVLCGLAGLHDFLPGEAAELVSAPLESSSHRCLAQRYRWEGCRGDVGVCVCRRSHIWARRVVGCGCWGRNIAGLCDLLGWRCGRGWDHSGTVGRVGARAWRESRAAALAVGRVVGDIAERDVASLTDSNAHLGKLLDTQWRPDTVCVRTVDVADGVFLKCELLITTLQRTIEDCSVALFAGLGAAVTDRCCAYRGQCCWASRRGRRNWGRGHYGVGVLGFKLLAGGDFDHGGDPV